jgi:YkoY family integral membrane protein
MFGQTFEGHDLAIIGLLIVLEGVLSIDNALVLGILARRLPKHQQKQALTYGLIGAFVFRILAIALAAVLLRWWFVKLLGGAYLIYITVKHFFFEEHHEHAAPEVGHGDAVAVVNPQTGEPLTKAEEEKELAAHVPIPLPAAVAAPGRKFAKFWPTVLVIELTDVAFAIDSILAAMALIAGVPHDPSKTHPKLWVVIAGGFLGVVLMRFAAVVFIKLLDKFPRLATAAYMLVFIIGVKLLVDWYFNKPPDNLPPGTVFHGPADFHSLSSPAFWVFWVLMLACFAYGFMPRREKDSRKAVPVTP